MQVSNYHWKIPQNDLLCERQHSAYCRFLGYENESQQAAETDIGSSYGKAAKSPTKSLGELHRTMEVDQAVIPEGTCQSGSFRTAFRNCLSQLGKTYNLLTWCGSIAFVQRDWAMLYVARTYNIHVTSCVRSMLYVCYMFGKHVTCHKASGYRGLRPVML